MQRYLYTCSDGGSSLYISISARIRGNLNNKGSQLHSVGHNKVLEIISTRYCSRKRQSQRCKASTQVHSTSSRASGARKLLWIPQPISFLTGISPSPSLLLPHHSSPSSCLLLVVLSTSSRSAPSRPPLAMCVSQNYSSQLPLTLAQASKVAVLGAAGGIGQPLSLLLKLNPRVSNLALYDIRGGPGKLDFN